MWEMMLKLPWIKKRHAILGVFSILTACGYRDFKNDDFSENAGELKTATFSVINRMIIQPKCVSCHVHAEGSEESLHNYNAVREFVTPGNPSRSKLLREVKTGEMPILMPALTDDEVLAIDHWIRNGSLND